MQDVPVIPTILGTSKPMPSSLNQDTSLNSYRSKASSNDNSLSSSSVFEPGSVFDSPDGDCLLLADGGSSGNACHPPAAELVSSMLDQAAAAAAAAGFHPMDCSDPSDPSLPELLFPAADESATLDLQPLEHGTVSLSPFLCTGPPLPQSSINNPSALRDLATAQHQSLQAAAGATASGDTAHPAAAGNAAAPGGGGGAVLVPVPLPPTAATAAAAPASAAAGSTGQEKQLQVYKLMVLDDETGEPMREATLEESLELEKSLEESKEWLCKGSKGFSWFTALDQAEAAAPGAGSGAAVKGGKSGKQKQKQQKVAGGDIVPEKPGCVKGLGEKQQQQQQGEEEGSEGAAAKSTLVRTFSSKCGGPCDHCGVKGEKGRDSSGVSLQCKTHACSVPRMAS